MLIRDDDTTTQVIRPGATPQDFMEFLTLQASNEGGTLEGFEFFLDPQGTHLAELVALELRLAWEAIRGIATYSSEFVQDKHTPKVGICNHAVSEVGPTLKDINYILKKEGRQVRAVISPLGQNIFQLEWQK